MLLEFADAMKLHHRHHHLRFTSTFPRLHGSDGFFQIKFLQPLLHLEVWSSVLQPDALPGANHSYRRWA